MESQKLLLRTVESFRNAVKRPYNILSEVITEWCSLELSLHKVLDYNDRKFLVLAKSLKNTFEGLSARNFIKI